MREQAHPAALLMVVTVTRFLRRSFLAASLLAACSAGGPAGADNYNAGVNFLGHGDRTQAEQQFKLALQTNPEFAEAYLNLGQVYLGDQDWDGSEENTKRAMDILERTHRTYVAGSTWQQTLAIAYNNLGAADLGRMAQAMARQDVANVQLLCSSAEADFEQALRLDPSQSKAHGNLDRLAGLCSASAGLPARGSPVPTPAPAAVQRSSAAEIAAAATVRIDSPSVQGSGTYLGSDRVLTAAHVVSGRGPFTVAFGGRTVGVAVATAIDPRYDLALLVVPGLDQSGAIPLVWGSLDQLRLGDQLTVAGFPSFVDITVTQGIFSGLKSDGRTDYVQTDAAINPGNSGGPVVNAAGQLVGIADWQVVSASGRSAQGLGFAVAATSARAFVEASGSR